MSHNTPPTPQQAYEQSVYPRILCVGGFGRSGSTLVGRILGCDVRIIHLVRDSRAVAYSWTRNKGRPSPIGEQKLMPQFRPADTAIRWVVSNAALHMLAAKVSYTRVKYEEFILYPS